MYFSRQSEATTAATTDVVTAEYNLDMGKWVCPTSNAKPAITASEDTSTQTYTTSTATELSVNASPNENEQKKVGGPQASTFFFFEHEKCPILVHFGFTAS